jgi:hypothetical protein
MRCNLGCILVLLLLGIPHLANASDACALESAYREQLATLQMERKEKESLIGIINSRIQGIRSQLPFHPSETEGRRLLEEKVAGYVNERRSIFTDLRLIRDTVKQTSEQVGEAHRACIRSKGRSRSPGEGGRGSVSAAGSCSVERRINQLAAVYDKRLPGCVGAGGTREI